MSLPNELLPVGLLGTGAAGGYQIERSLRFNSSDSAYLSRTPASAGNRKTWTWAGWVKRSAFGSTQGVFEAGTGAGTDTYAGLLFNSSNQIFCGFANAASNDTYIQTSAVFRDCSAWYHIVVAVDTTSATNTDRVKLYVNNQRITVFSDSAYGAQNTDSIMNTANLFVIGQRRNSSTAYFNGYLADIHFIDGQALDPTSFGEFDTNGVWQPIEYQGEYGTNGFHLPFSDNSTASALGTDTSGNGNTWTVNNFSVTAGAGNDSLVDTPTSYGTDTGAGGSVRGNYCTLNPLSQNSFSITNGNLDASTSQGLIYGYCQSTFPILNGNGKFYFEVRVVSAVGGSVDLVPVNPLLSTQSGGTIVISNYAYSIYAESDTGRYFIGKNGSYQTDTGVSAINGDIIQVAFDSNDNKLWFGVNGTWLGGGSQNPVTGTGGLSGSTGLFPYVPSLGDRAGGSTFAPSFQCNFGQRPFAYTAPSGFKALCTTNLPDPVVAKPSEVMDVITYSGNGSTQSISGLNFSPDFGWFKRRGPDAASHFLFDQVRGAGKFLVSNTTASEGNDAVNTLQSFDSTGYTMGNTGAMNESGSTYVVWSWDAGSSTVSNTDGSITSQVRANPSAGFSIVTYTGTGVAGTIGHGLGVAPSMVIVKSRSTTNDWPVYHIGLTSAAYWVKLNLGEAQVSNNNVWNSTSPTSSVFSVNNNSINNGSTVTYVAYCFAPVAGYSSFGSYTGNGSTDGPFINLSFRPKWIMIKQSGASGENWEICDSLRNGYNFDNTNLYANLSSSEAGSGGANTRYDILSNGFKIRTSNPGVNANGSGYIYAAFAESPFQYSRAR